ncbi:MAG: hypothetical protein JO128_08460, partial [Alphaproteobacteria bacterium]|nr:hypothetical protein [Alphaproteobacteria bacterium]
MTPESSRSAEQLAAQTRVPPTGSSVPPDPTQILFGMREPPPFKEDNIFPLEWRVETPKMMQIYDGARDPG